MTGTPEHVRLAFQGEADRMSAHVRNLMDGNPTARLLAERTADMITDQHGKMPGLGRAIVSAAYAVEVSSDFLSQQSDEEMDMNGALNLLAAVGQVLAEREGAQS